MNPELWKKESLDLFIGKLKEKKQNDQQLKQAFHAVSLYYELGLVDLKKDSVFKDDGLVKSQISLTRPL